MLKHITCLISSARVPFTWLTLFDLKEPRLQKAQTKSDLLGSIVGFGPVGLSVLHPRSEFVNKGGEAPDGPNNGSVVGRMDYVGRSVLFTGDIEHEKDRVLLVCGTRLSATILKAAHHGSRKSSTPAFLDAVSPEWVVVSRGIDNKFRHPAPEVMGRYESIGATRDRTDLSRCLTYRIRAWRCRGI